MTDRFDIDLPGNSFLSAESVHTIEDKMIEITVADRYGSPASTALISFQQALALARWLTDQASNKAASGRAEPESREQERNTAAKTAAEGTKTHGRDE